MEYLTPQKIKIIKLVAEGYENSEIAKLLNISISTVKTYLRTIFEDLCLRNRAQLAAWAVKNGLL